MKEFRSLEEVDRAGLGACAYRAVHGTLKRLIDAYAECGQEYVPEDDGHVVLLEPEDTDVVVRSDTAEIHRRTYARHESHSFHF